MEVIWKLGAKDPEMDRIEEVLNEIGERVEHAMIDGERVHVENAYRADPVVREHAFIPVWVECRSRGTRKTDAGLIVDHHRRGDPGYALASKHFWDASSLGQVFGLIRHRPSRHDLTIAAVDHSPRDAFAGKCPGVQAHDATWHRRIQIATSCNVDTRAVQYLVDEYGAMFADARTIEIAGEAVLDLRHLDLGVGYSLAYLSFQQALLEHGVEDAMFIHRVTADGPRRVTVNGTAPVVRAFMRSWAPAHGLSGIYGVPSRHYAGGYESASK